MAYIQTQWENNQPPALNRINLRNIEDAIGNIANPQYTAFSEPLKRIVNSGALIDAGIRDLDTQGRMIYNPVKYANINPAGTTTIDSEGNVVLLSDSGGAQDSIVLDDCSFKPNTQYTILCSIKNISTTSPLRITSNGVPSSGIDFLNLGLGLVKALITTKSTITIQQLQIYLSSIDIGGTLTIAGDGNGKPLIYAIEGDIAVEYAPSFFEDLFHVEGELRSIGKNKFDFKKALRGFYSNANGNFVETTTHWSSELMNKNDVDNYYFSNSGTPTTVGVGYSLWDINGTWIEGGVLTSPIDLSSKTFDLITISFRRADSQTYTLNELISSEIMFEQNTIATDFEKNEQSTIPLNLKASPRGVSDTLVLKKINTFISTGNLSGYITGIGSNNDLSAGLVSYNSSSEELIQNTTDSAIGFDGIGTLKTVASINTELGTEKGIRILNSTQLYYIVPTSLLASNTLVGLQTYFNNNTPVIQAELATPVSRQSQPITAYVGGTLEFTGLPPIVFTGDFPINTGAQRESTSRGLTEVSNKIPNHFEMIITTDGWVASSVSGFSFEKTISIDGIKASDVVDFEPTIEDIEVYESALLQYIQELDGAIKVYSRRQQTQSFKVKVLIRRG